jgi:hypothetical protein
LGAWDFSSKGLTAWYRARGPSAFTVNTSVTFSELTTSKGMIALLAGSAGISHHHIDVVNVRENPDSRRRVGRVAAFNLYQL